jgi:hypothetical protein
MGRTFSSFKNSLVLKPRQRGDHDPKKGRSAVEEDEGDDDDDDDDGDGGDIDGPASCHCRSRDDDDVCLDVVCSCTWKNVAHTHAHTHTHTHKHVVVQCAAVLSCNRIVRLVDFLGSCSIWYLERPLFHSNVDSTTYIWLVIPFVHRLLTAVTRNVILTLHRSC